MNNNNELIYLDLIQKEASKKESMTSHLFISYLYKSTSVKFYNLIPQGSSKKGQIDYLYMPPNRNVNMFVEIKSYGHIHLNEKTHQKARKQTLLRMKSNKKGTFPDILKRFDREDIWRIGLLTDLRNTYIFLRNKKYSTPIFEFALDFLNTDFISIKEIFKKLKQDLFIFSSNFKISKFCHEIIWNIVENRYKLIYFELIKDKKLKNKIYIEWKKFMGYHTAKGRKGIRDEFENNLKKVMQCDRDFDNQKNIISNILNQPKIRKALFNKLKKYDIPKVQGAIKKIM